MVPALFYLAVFGVAIKVFILCALLVYLYFLIFHTGPTLLMTAGGLLMGFLKKIPDPVVAAVLLTAGIYYFFRWIRSPSSSPLSSDPLSSAQLKIEGPVAEKNEDESAKLN
ncbi:hypothetical protein AFK24_09885 [Pseudomonas syringae]|uniref:Uncharacterized protein n=1 Tax=Pseudomonas syringae TaxID=317 RepID=A0A1C7Z5L2_PSESX|nr:hypothetical protein AFK24_09885 [Pseudomonas syringae]